MLTSANYFYPQACYVLIDLIEYKVSVAEKKLLDHYCRKFNIPTKMNKNNDRIYI